MGYKSSLRILASIVKGKTWWMSVLSIAKTNTNQSFGRSKTALSQRRLQGIFIKKRWQKDKIMSITRFAHKEK